METTFVLLDLGGAVALLLWGVHMVQSGVQRAFGGALRRVLARASRRRLGALLTGLAVTAALQSSTATGLMVASFAASGLVALVPALAAMLGANIGTTLIVQALSFDVTRFAAPLLLTGLVMFRVGAARARDLGRAALGLGLMLLALARLIAVVAPYEKAPALRVLLDGVAADPLVSVLFGAIFAWAAHSSVAVVLLVASLVGHGSLAAQAGFALILGANVGTALNPLFEGASSGAVAGRRVAFGNLATRLAGVLIALPLLPWVARALPGLAPDASRAAAHFHTVFNIAVAALALPLLGPLARALERFVPDRAGADDPGRPLYLDPAALDAPAVALGHAKREALRMADVLGEMFAAAAGALDAADRDALARTRRLDDALDALNHAIRRYLGALDRDALTDEEHRSLEAILTFAFNLESAGDVLDRNVAAGLAKGIKREAGFAAAARAPVEEALAAVRRNLHLAASVFATGDGNAARRLADEKAAFRRRESETRRAAIERLRVNEAASDPATLDLLRDVKRCNAHLVAGAAYPILEASGALAPSRLLEPDACA